jgi:hypothetical protein
MLNAQHLKMPAAAPSGLVPVVVTVGSGTRQSGITIAVQ